MRKAPTIQENMNYLSYVESVLPQYKNIIDKTADLIQWFGVQPEIEVIFIEEHHEIMLFWDLYFENYLSIYVGNLDIVFIEEKTEQYIDEPNTFEATIDEAIDYYNTIWHEDLFAYEMENEIDWDKYWEEIRNENNN